MKAAVLFMAMLAAYARVGHAAPALDAAVAIRTYNYATVPAEQLAGAKAEAERTFRNARISLAWIECRVPGAVDGAACTEPLLEGRDLMLRLVDRPLTQGERIIALGESMLDREVRSGVLMTIDLFPVRTIAGRASLSIPVLLGRAIAHEIGHLLLGSAEHPRLGLMRALWSHDELRGLKPAHWGFSTREAAQMRQTLLGKSRTAD
jgi:hypothetical protein